MKRFYKDVAVQEAPGGFQVALDGRGIKTVKGAAQIVPHAPLAEALAAEWRDQGEELDPTSLPLRDMVDYAIDIVSADTHGVIGKMIAYGDTDTLLYRADPDEPLHQRQLDVWEPIVTAFEQRIAAPMTRISGIIHRPQSDAAMAALRPQLDGHTPIALAALEAMTNLAASLIIALTAADDADEGHARSLWRAASLEEEWQAELWGHDEEADKRREKRERDFLTAHRALHLAQGNAA